MPTTKRTAPDADHRGAGVKEEFAEALGAAP